MLIYDISEALGKGGLRFLLLGAKKVRPKIFAIARGKLATHVRVTQFGFHGLNAIEELLFFGQTVDEYISIRSAQPAEQVSPQLFVRNGPTAQESSLIKVTESEGLLATKFDRAQRSVQAINFSRMRNTRFRNAFCSTPSSIAIVRRLAIRSASIPP